MCVWLIICEMFQDRVEFDPDDLKPMGQWRKDKWKGHLSFRTVNSNGEGPFVLEKEDAKKLKLECDEVWKTWENEFAHAAGVCENVLILVVH